MKKKKLISKLEELNGRISDLQKSNKDLRDKQFERDFNIAVDSLSRIGSLDYELTVETNGGVCSDFVRRTYTFTLRC